jgi:hypothetical protein
MRRLGFAVLVGAALLSACSRSSNECPACIAEKCSDLVSLCAPDDDCACMVDCLGQQGVPGVEGCLGACDLAERPPLFAAVEECTAVACPDAEDECSTPSDWSPPDTSFPCDGAGAGGIGSGELADCELDPTLPFDPDGAVLQLASEDGSLCARLERRDDGPGSLANTQWALLELRVGPIGEVAAVSSATELCYYSSHHNFRDWAHAWSGARHYDLELAEDGHDGERTYSLYAFEAGPLDPASCGPSADGARCIEGPIPLLPVGP